VLIDFHRTIVADRLRNEAFHEALRRVIVPGRTTVADVGSGTGLLGFMAARLGAKRVYLYEHGDVMKLAKVLARRNHIRRCVFIPEHSTAVIDPEPVDVVVSETLGNFAYEERLLETMGDARRFLRSGGTVIPQRVRQFLAPVASDRFHRELTVWQEVGYGLDLEPAARMSLNNLYVRTLAPADLSTLPARCCDEADLRRANRSRRECEASWRCERAETMYGFALWWECELVPGIDLSTSPHAARTHWDQLYLPLLEPIRAQAGDEVTVVLRTDTGIPAGVSVRWRVQHTHAGRVHEQSLDIRKGYLG
jgi:protein arginine N-methyltransferase 1